MPERIKCIPRWRVALNRTSSWSEIGVANDRIGSYETFAGMKYEINAYIYDTDGFSAWCKVQGLYGTDGLLMPAWAKRAHADGRLAYGGAVRAKPWGRRRRWRRV